VGGYGGVFGVWGFVIWVGLGFCLAGGCVMVGFGLKWVESGGPKMG